MNTYFPFVSGGSPQQNPAEPVFSNALLIDISNCQPKLVLSEMSDVFAVFGKGGQGDYSKDNCFDPHCLLLDAAGKRKGGYWWDDPLEPVGSSVTKADSVFKGKVKVVMLDVEQYWSDWLEWANRSITKIIPAKKISDHARDVASGLAKLGYKVVIYTRMSFVHEYAPQMSGWMTQYDLCLASYPFKAGRVTISWEKLKSIIFPLLPFWPVGPNGKRAKFWQISGDKFLLPGTYDDLNRQTPLDIIVYDGTVEECAIWWGETPSVQKPNPEPIPQPQPVTPEILKYTITIGPRYTYPTSSMKGRALHSVRVGQVIEIDPKNVVGRVGQMLTPYKGEWVDIGSGVKKV